MIQKTNRKICQAEAKLLLNPINHENKSA